MYLNNLKISIELKCNQIFICKGYKNPITAVSHLPARKSISVHVALPHNYCLPYILLGYAYTTRAACDGIQNVPKNTSSPSSCNSLAIRRRSRYTYFGFLYYCFGHHRVSREFMLFPDTHVPNAEYLNTSYEP